MISVTKLHAFLDAGHTAAYDLRGDIEALLPRDGLVLSADEVAQIARALEEASLCRWAGFEVCSSCRKQLQAALSLLDSAGEET